MTDEDFDEVFCKNLFPIPPLEDFKALVTKMSQERHSEDELRLMGIEPSFKRPKGELNLVQSIHFHTSHF